jgi:hypothetical protein
VLDRIDNILLQDKEKKEEKQNEEESSTDNYRNDIMGKCRKKTENDTKLKRGN